MILIEALEKNDNETNFSPPPSKLKTGSTSQNEEISFKEWGKKGLKHKKEGNYIVAIQCYNKALEINPQDLQTLLNKGIVLKLQGKYDEAIQCYDEALKINPEYPNAWKNKALGIEKMGKIEESKNCLDAYNLLEKDKTENERVPPKAILICQACQSEARYIEQYQRYYCNQCKKYL